MAKNDLTAEFVRAVLQYDQTTGVFRWRVSLSSRRGVGTIAGTLDPSGYFRISIRRSFYWAHRLAWLHFYGRWPSDQIDHIDGNGQNNAISNLREATPAINTQNVRRAKSTSRTGILGVCLEGERFRVNICVNGKARFVGRYASLKEAHAAYIEAKRRLHPGCMI